MMVPGFPCPYLTVTGDNHHPCVGLLQHVGFEMAQTVVGHMPAIPIDVLSQYRSDMQLQLFFAGAEITMTDLAQSRRSTTLAITAAVGDQQPEPPQPQEPLPQPEAGAGPGWLECISNYSEHKLIFFD